MHIRIGATALAALLASCASAPATAPKALTSSHPYRDYSWAGAADREAEEGDGVWAGVFIEGGAADTGLIKSLETQVGRKFAVVMWFADYSTPFPAAEAEKVWASGAVPNITWEPWLWKDQDKIHLADINAGKYDAYITEWGRAAAAFGKPVMVRWGHEFNGDWYPWSIAKNGQNAKDYVKAYRRVHDLVTKAGAGNVVWVWCPNQANFPPQAWNNPALAYPGDDVVDWVALDGYDFDGNATFAQLFSRPYAETIKLIDKPMFIGEMSTGRTGAAKAAWLEDMQAALVTQFPAVKGVVWFNINKERDWRLEGSPESLKAAADVFQAPMFRSRPESVPELAAVADRQYIASRNAAKTLLQVERATLTAPRAGDWSTAKPLAIQGKDGLGGTMQVAWDDEGLHLLASVRDSYPMVNAQDKDGIWNGDCIEFVLSTNPAADLNRGYFDVTDWQVGLTPGDKAKGLAPRTWEWSKLKSPVAGARVTASPAEGGYRLEAVIPWASLKFKPSAGMKLGFDIAVDDAGKSGTRSAQWVWNGTDQFYNNPVQWGTLILGQ